jgi:NhaA family Na+:H+ antiporter
MDYFATLAMTCFCRVRLLQVNRCIMPTRAIQNFLHSEYTGGFLLLAATMAALLLANSPLETAYHEILAVKLALPLPGLDLELSLHHWINDGLMAVFFLLVGLEIKRECVQGELASTSRAALPVLCAIGGVVAPALIYMAINRLHPVNWPGWAIPAATDIAFALGVLSLGGKAVPLPLKIFLTALAIIDDLMAILIIALFYGEPLKIDPFFIAVLLVGGLCALNMLRVRRIWPYLLVGIGLWYAVLQSGLHPTLAGVALALTIPVNEDRRDSPLHRLEHTLHPYSAFLIVPLFALANAGLSFTGLNFLDLSAPVPLGIAFGLFLGKPLGIYGAGLVARKLGWASLPQGVTRLQFLAVSCIAGVGFTMSLFIGALAFRDPAMGNIVRLGVILGSLLSAAMGITLLRQQKPA